MQNSDWTGALTNWSARDLIGGLLAFYVIYIIQKFIGIGMSSLAELDRSTSLLYDILDVVKRKFDEMPLNLRSVDDLDSHLQEIRDKHDDLLEVQKELLETLTGLSSFVKNSQYEYNFDNINNELSRINDKIQTIVDYLPQQRVGYD